MKATDVLRKEIKKSAEERGIFDNKVPSRAYCRITIEAMSKILGMSLPDLIKTIETYKSSS